MIKKEKGSKKLKMNNEKIEKLREAIRTVKRSSCFQDESDAINEIAETFEELMDERVFVVGHKEERDTFVRELRKDRIAIFEYKDGEWTWSSFGDREDIEKWLQKSSH